MLKAPFPYFGGKARVANIVWRELGNVKHYIEPFCGSAAVLLMRPGYNPRKHVETVNDADGMIANVWRALQSDPDAVREWCLSRGSIKSYRIVLAGYDGEHNELESHGWRVYQWAAGGGYSRNGTRGESNRNRERLWFSPHCTGDVQQTEISFD